MSANEYEKTAIHESAHAVVWLLEEEHLGPLTLVTAFPHEDTLGRVRGEDGALSPPTPRKLRAMGRVIAAGAIAAKLAGLSKGADWRDAAKLAGLALVAAKLEKPVIASGQVQEKRAKCFTEQSKAGAELQLRSHWGAVRRLAATLRQLGILTPPHGIAIARMQLEGPQQPLAPDLDTLQRLLGIVEGVPEIVEPFLAEARQHLARVA